MQRNILIVEDNEAHMNALLAIIKDLHQNVKVYCATNIDDAYSMALKYNIHLFLVDIILNTKNPGDVSGLKFATKMRGFVQYKYIPLVFITSLEDPKLFSYSELNCLGYIEKPFSVGQVKNVIIKALDFPIKEDDDHFVHFRKDGITYSVYIRDIVYIENSRRKIRIVCVNDELEIPYITCKQILEELNSKSFIPCSRYCIVNKKYVVQTDYANRYVKLRHIDEPIEIGIIMKKSFKERMEDDDE